MNKGNVIAFGLACIVVIVGFLAMAYAETHAATGGTTGRYQFIATRSSDINTPRLWAMDTGSGQIYQLIIPPRGARYWKKYWGPIR